ncbi:MAG: hypothetical protein AAF982_07970 [Pseudomonadota bacterium]
MQDATTPPRNSEDGDVFEINAEQPLNALTRIDATRNTMSNATGDPRAATRKADCLRSFKPMFGTLYPEAPPQVPDMLDKTAREAAAMEGDLGGEE